MYRDYCVLYGTEIIVYYNMVQRLLRIIVQRLLRIIVEIIAYYSTEIIVYYNMVQRLLHIIIWYRDYCVL